MKSQEIRQRFLDYFKRQGHKIIPSASLVPADPTVLLTLAGMLPFKKAFLGEEDPPAPRTASCQRCLRMNDLENVGLTPRHHTFFEMLGNFSFGDYGKEEAISWAWDFLTKELDLPREKLWAAIFYQDEEAGQIWQKKIKIPAARLVRLDEDNNFWAAGPTGPCGPCSEIYYDLGPGRGCGRKDCRPGCDCDRFLEVWNLVFMELNRDEAGHLTPLPKKNIDTGMGLERISAIRQGQDNNFETDLFRPLLAEIERTTGCRGEGRKQDEKTEIACRVIADHLRAMVFLAADGVRPANEGRGYVLRRLIRRAMAKGRQLGRTEPFLNRLVGTVVKKYGGYYDHLPAKQAGVAGIIAGEEETFQRTLREGLDQLARIIKAKVFGRPTDSASISGDDLFFLSDSFGFPLELSLEALADQGIKIDRAKIEEEFAAALEKQRCRGRDGGLGRKEEGPSGGESLTPQDRQEELALAQHHTATHLLHAALRKVLGEGAVQSGSLVDLRYLRFDFAYPRALSEQQLEEVERLVNQYIQDDLPVKKTETSYDEAIKAGATALFGEKYGEKIRLVRMGEVSLELCGGHHLDRTGQALAFKITAESAVAAGVRRIEAVAGGEALKALIGAYAELKGISRLLMVPVGETKEKVAGLQTGLKEKDKEISSLWSRLAGLTAEKLAGQAEKIGEIDYISASFEAVPVDYLRQLSDQLKNKLPRAVVLLASAEKDKVSWVAAVAKNLTGQGFSAGQMISAVSQMTEGKGGGRPELAQGGGKRPDKIDQAFQYIKEELAKKSNGR